MFRILRAGSARLQALPWRQTLTTHSPVVSNIQHYNQIHRSFCSQTNPDELTPKRRRLLPPLMSFDEVIWPSIIKSFRSFIFVHFIIRPYLDDEFVVKDFTLGAKQAVHVISNKLSSCDWDGLKGIVADDCVPELKENVAKMNLAQRSEVAIAKDDIYLTFPYQVRYSRSLI